MRHIVQVLSLANGLKLMWIVADGLKAPVIEWTPGHARLIKTPADNLVFCSVLDAVMAQRRAGTYPRSILDKSSAGVECVEMEFEGGDAQWLPMDWTSITFGDLPSNTYPRYQELINITRRSLAA